MSLLIVSCECNNNTAKEERIELDGTWVVESVVRDPSERGAGEGNGLRITISGENIVVKDSREDETLGKARIKIDETKWPNAIDITCEGKNEVVHGVYKLKGDTLSVCWGAIEKKERPTEFATRPGSGQTLVLLKKQKP